MLTQQAIVFWGGAHLILLPLRNPVSCSGSLHSGRVATEHMIRVTKIWPKQIR